jgi:acyl-CoA synthetase (AMP-forming)/AMP-acid ligase II
VAAALTAGVPDPLLGERLHVLIVPRAGATLDAGTLADWATGRIERFKIPDAFHFAPELPLGRTGKADRGALRGWINDRIEKP